MDNTKKERVRFDVEIAYSGKPEDRDRLVEWIEKSFRGGVTPFGKWEVIENDIQKREDIYLNESIKRFENKCFKWPYGIPRSRLIEWMKEEILKRGKSNEV